MAQSDAGRRSTARARALAELAKRHAAEFEEIHTKELANIGLKRAVDMTEAEKTEAKIARLQAQLKSLSK